MESTASENTQLPVWIFLCVLEIKDLKYKIPCNFPLLKI